MRALVVTGGTDVDIDDIRVITNKSAGRLGCTVANAFAARGVATTLLAARRTLEHKDWVRRFAASQGSRREVRLRN